MAQPKLSHEEWRTLVGLAERLGISLPASLDELRFGELESVARRLGRALAQATTERLADERAEQSPPQESCPTCGKRCAVEHRRRKLLSVDGPVEFSEPAAHCSACRRIFFPQRVKLGLDQRQSSPAVIDKIVSANAEHKSPAKAQKMLAKLAEIEVSAPLIEDDSREIGAEHAANLQRQALAHAAGTLPREHAEPPSIATVSVDGGRILTRAEGPRGVHEPQWKETKNACLLTMSGATFAADPHPELPTCFQQQTYVEKLVREMHAARGKAAENADDGLVSAAEEASVSHDAEPDSAGENAAAERPDWRPQRLVRSCLSSLCSSDEFGPLVAGEAQRRGFYDAARRAFLGDGQAWNWTLQERHFADFTPITDFIHPLGYLYEAARALAPTDTWRVCLHAAEACWQGRVGEVLAAFREWQAQHPLAEDESVGPHDPRAVVARTVTYLTNNQSRMNYPAYRQAGLPVTSAMIESLIKEINYRVKGTEKFWNRPSGAEAILQIRAAALDDQDRLSRWILNRPGSAFHRRPTPLAAAA